MSNYLMDFLMRNLVASEIVFTDWKNLDDWLNNGLKQGFAFTITRRVVVTIVYFDVVLMHLMVNIIMRYRKLDPDDIKLLVTCGVRAGAIIEVLQKKYLDKYVHARIVYNIDQVIQHKNSGTSKDNHLARLSWMRLSQLQLWGQFHDIILTDNHNRSRLATIAIISDETKDTFSWLFSSHLHAIGELISKLLFIDADLAMIAAHFLGEYRGEKWKKLFTALCYARNSRVESIFEENRLHYCKSTV
ncbi:4409_t:CDS:2 [Rhizophagus irregularis]|nr:4409_t:CDS:2 [Rhizophagus irregularis]